MSLEQVLQSSKGALKQFLREMPEPLIPAEWANGLMEMVRNSDWSNWSDRDRKVEIIQVLVTS